MTRAPARRASRRPATSRPVVLCVAMALWLLARSTAPGATVSASLDRNTIRVGESAALTLTFEGGSPSATPLIPAMANLRVGSPSYSSRYTFVNGQSSAQVIYSYALVPQATGEFTIPPVSVRVGSSTVATQPLKLTVLKSDAPSAPPDSGLGQSAFLRLLVPKQEAFVGEILAIEVQLYVALNGRDLQTPQLPGDGFVVGKIGQPSQTRTQVGGTTYNVVVFKTTVTPIRAGEIALGPAECRLNVQVPQARSRRDDWLDPFDLLGSRAVWRSVSLTSETLKLRVLPLPDQGRPTDFNGAVGQFSLAVSASPTNVAVGDPITVTVQINGTGALDALTLPPQPAWQDFKLYPPTAKLSTEDELAISGAKVFEQVAVPQVAEIRELPAFRFSYFDVTNRQYRTLVSPPVPLSVRPAVAGAVQPTVLAAGIGQAETPAEAKDIVHIKADLGAISASTLPLVGRPWFLAVQAVPALLWIGLLARRKRGESLERNPRLRREREVTRFTRAALGELRRLAAANESEQFFAALFRLLQEQLGERLDLPASAITEAAIDERLRPLGMEDAEADRLHTLFQACNLARYAPERSAAGLSAMLPEIEAAVATLRRIRV